MGDGGGGMRKEMGETGMEGIARKGGWRWGQVMGGRRRIRARGMPNK